MNLFLVVPLQVKSTVEENLPYVCKKKTIIKKYIIIFPISTAMT